MNVKEFIKAAIPDRILIHRLKKRGSRSVLFTFDDGPNPEFTPVILDILKESQARAVFFVIGSRARSAPDLVRRISEEGHILGNHSYDHYLEKRVSFQDYRADVKKCQETITGIIGEEPVFFRPPGGVVSMTSLTTGILSGMTTMLWSIEGHEWTRDRKIDADLISRQLTAGLRGGDIVLMHDDNPKVPYVLKTVLQHLKNDEFDLSNGIQYT